MLNSISYAQGEQCKKLGLQVSTDNFYMRHIVERSMSPLNFKLLVEDIVNLSGVENKVLSVCKHVELFEECVKWINSIGDIKESRLDDIVELVEDIEADNSLRVEVNLCENSSDKGLGNNYDLAYLICRYFRVNW